MIERQMIDRQIYRQIDIKRDIPFLQQSFHSRRAPGPGAETESRPDSRPCRHSSRPRYCCRLGREFRKESKKRKKTRFDQEKKKRKENTVSTKKVRFKKKKEGNGKRKFVLNKISSNLFESRNDINYYMWLKVKLIFFSTEKLFFYRFLGRDRVFFFFLIFVYKFPLLLAKSKIIRREAKVMASFTCTSVFVRLFFRGISMEIILLFESLEQGSALYFTCTASDICRVLYFNRVNRYRGLASSATVM